VDACASSDFPAPAAARSRGPADARLSPRRRRGRGVRPPDTAIPRTHRDRHADPTPTSPPRCPCAT
jgi:hypothetical protein